MFHLIINNMKKAFSGNFAFSARTFNTLILFLHCLLKIRLYGIFYNCNASDLKILKQLKLSLMRSVWVIWIQSHLPCICILNFYSREISCNILLRPTALYSRDATFMIIIFLKYTLNIVEHKKKWFHTDSRGNKVQP